MAQLKDEDLLLVNRDDVTYKVKFEDVKNTIDPPPPPSSIEQPTILAPPDGAGIGGDVTYTPKTSAITSVATIATPGYDPANVTTSLQSGTELGSVANMFSGNGDSGFGVQTGSLDMVFNPPVQGSNLDIIAGEVGTGGSITINGTVSYSLSSSPEVNVGPNPINSIVILNGVVYGFQERDTGKFIANNPETISTKRL